MSDPAPYQPPVTVSERPEISWLWRRWFSFTLVALCVALMAAILFVLARGVGEASAMALAKIATWAAGLIALVAILYLGGATASEIVQLVAAARGCFPRHPRSGDDNQ